MHASKFASYAIVVSQLKFPLGLYTQGYSQIHIIIVLESKGGKSLQIASESGPKIQNSWRTHPTLCDSFASDLCTYIILSVQYYLHLHTWVTPNFLPLYTHSFKKWVYLIISLLSCNNPFSAHDHELKMGNHSYNEGCNQTLIDSITYLVHRACSEKVKYSRGAWSVNYHQYAH